MNPRAQRAWLLGGGAWLPGAALPVTDRAVRYGMSVFETIGVRGGRPLLAGEHLGLLGESAAVLLGIPRQSIPGTLPVMDPGDTGVLRLYVTAGDGSAHDAAEAPRVFALFESLPHGTVPAEQSARLHPEAAAPFGHGRKTSNYWLQCEAQRAARGAGFDHALLADHCGKLLSAAFGNVFFVSGGELCTPALSLAVRPGVIRAWVMRRHPVREVEFSAGQLDGISELFMTNSRLGVMPLRCGAVAPGPVGRGLRDDCLRENITP